MTATYLSLTNDAIQESGADLASFATDGSDWTSTTDSLRLKFQKWVARAWKEIQQDSFDLSFMEEQAVVNVDPGFMFYTDGHAASAFGWALDGFTVDILDQDGTTAISAIPIKSSYDLTGVSTNTAPFGYLNVLTTTSTPIEWALKPGAEYFTVDAPEIQITSTITVVGSPPVILPLGQLPDPDSIYDMTYNGVTYEKIARVRSYVAGVLGTVTFHVFDLAVYNAIMLNGNSVQLQQNGVTLISTAASSSVSIQAGNVVYTAHIHSWKSFDFSEETDNDDFQENIKEIDQKSFRIINYFQAPPQGEVPLTFIPWEVFQPQYDISSSPPGIPRIITRDNTNRFRLYPHPYQTMTLKFDYIRTPQILSDFDDEPKGIDDDITDMIMWRALIMYGEYDEQPSVIARANKNWKNFQLRFDQKYRPKFHFLPRRLW